MAAKYKTLVSLYSTEIANVKALKARMDAARTAVDANYKASGMDEGDHYIQERQLYAAWNDAESNYQIALEKLTSNIRDEYAEVPFGATAEAGVDAFFREANI
jgi:hypothetical protein